MEGRKEAMRVLVEAGADVHLANEKGETPLHGAAWNDHEEAMRVLVEAGADVHLEDEEGCTPLHRAAWNGCVETVDMLLKAGADVNLADDNGCTPLYGAATEDHVEVILEAMWGTGEQETNKGYIYSVLGGPGHCARVLHVGA